MTENLIDKVSLQAKYVFQEFGFNVIDINNGAIYERNGKYRKFTFIKGLYAFVMEYAGSFEEAQRNMYEDGDLYPIALGEQQLISLLRDDIKKYYLA